VGIKETSRKLIDYLWVQRKKYGADGVGVPMGRGQGNCPDEKKLGEGAEGEIGFFRTEKEGNPSRQRLGGATEWKNKKGLGVPKFHINCKKEKMPRTADEHWLSCIQQKGGENARGGGPNFSEAGRTNALDNCLKNRGFTVWRGLSILKKGIL